MSDLPVDPERMRRQFPALTDADIAKLCAMTRWSLAQKEDARIVLPEVTSSIDSPSSGSGGPPGSPVTLIAPEVACATGSKHLKPL